ncbi:hypothetical protein ACIQ6Y_12060 [Streptomyces sp. NPDC096205]|uniref:hypothetical protein n=1 Tax=Streptomyces sp. NPDC096205 TaxID=3366081 RepID=UPI0038275D4E
MRKIITCGLLAAAALMTTTPAFANDGDSALGPGVNAANNWNFSAAAVCLQELAVVPVGGAWTGDHTNHCTIGNVLDQATGALGSLTRH